MKWKIAFVTRQMMMGGIEKALISLLKQLPEEKFEITLYLQFFDGELFDEIPDHVQVVYIFKEDERILSRIWKNIRKGKIKKAWDIFYHTILLLRTDQSEFDIFKHTCKTIQKTQKYMMRPLHILVHYFCLLSIHRLI